MLLNVTVSALQSSLDKRHANRPHCAVRQTIVAHIIKGGDKDFLEEIAFELSE